MKIKTIMCNTSQTFYDENVGVRLALATEEVELLVVNIKHGPESMESAYDEAMGAPSIIEQVVLAESEGCDAVLIDCSVDPVLRAAREISNLPVISAGEASHHAAMMLCSRFSVITVLPVSAKLIYENIHKYGYADRLASVRSANVPVLDLNNEEVATKAIYAEAIKAIDEDGAEAIVLGCTGMMAMRDKLEGMLGVPVIEPYSVGVQYAAAMVRLKLKQSKLAYEKPSDKKFI
ncbi:MAG: AroM family protein [Chloroflexi bacterium]|nr:AroM family protein [Chloroflexota bacterium]